VQGGRGENGVERLAAELITPAGRSEVGPDDGDAMVGTELSVSDTQECRVEIEHDGGCTRKPLEQPYGDRAGASGEVEDARLLAAVRLDDVDHPSESLFAVGQISLLLGVP
jgi:hypothetical protein